jgi:hypothetical protein
MNGQIFHRNNAKIVRAQTVVKAYERHLGSVQGAPLMLRMIEVARPYHAVTVPSESMRPGKVKMVKGRKRIVF